MQHFKPTHKITHNSKTIFVLLDLANSEDGRSGPLYTEDEWEAGVSADYEWDALQGFLLFQGQPPNGSWQVIQLPEKPSVKLLGQDGNAFAIIGKCYKAATQAGWSNAAWKEVETALTFGDYDRLLRTAMTYFDVR